MQRQKPFNFLLGVIVLIILISPLLYWASGVGQAAGSLSAELSRAADGTLLNSPKAEALHNLSLPMRLQRMLIYPLLLLAFHFSGGAVGLRRWLEHQAYPWLAAKFPALVRLSARVSRRVPGSWRQRLTGGDLLVIWLFVMLFNLGLMLLYLPFNFYRGFIVGHQFGLSTLSAAGWLADWGKSVLLNLAIDGSLMTGFFMLMRLLPHRWPVVGGGLLAVVTVFLTLISPLVVTPMFYTVTNLDDADLQDRIFALAERANMPVDEINVIDASSKTTAVNAYVTGFGGAQRMVLYDTLITGYSPAQVEVVVAHELGHWYYRHVLLGLVGQIAVAWLGLFVLRWLLHRSWRWLGLNSPADVAALPLILLAGALVGLASLPVENGISRFAEGQADDFALTVSQQPDAFIDFFEGLAGQNLSMVTVPAWEKLLFSTHPPISERIQKAVTFKARQAQTGY